MNILEKIGKFFNKIFNKEKLFLPKDNSTISKTEGLYSERFREEHSNEKNPEQINIERIDLKRQDQLQFAYKNIVKGQRNIDESMKKDLQATLARTGRSNEEIILSDLDLDILTNLKNKLGNLGQDNEIITYLDSNPKNVKKVIDEIGKKAIIEAGNYGITEEYAGGYVINPIETIKEVINSEKEVGRE